VFVEIELAQARSVTRCQSHRILRKVSLQILIMWLSFSLPLPA